MSFSFMTTAAQMTAQVAVVPEWSTYGLGIEAVCRRARHSKGDCCRRCIRTSGLPVHFSSCVGHKKARLPPRSSSLGGVGARLEVLLPRCRCGWGGSVLGGRTQHSSLALVRGSSRFEAGWCWLRAAEAEWPYRREHRLFLYGPCLWLLGLGRLCGLWRRHAGWLVVDGSPWVYPYAVALIVGWVKAVWLRVGACCPPCPSSGPTNCRPRLSSSRLRAWAGAWG